MALNEQSPSSPTGPTLEHRCINAVRGLCVDAIEAAGSGHPGLCLGAAPMAYVLFDRHLRHAPDVPDWPNRDRFVLSAGHGSMLLYALLHLTGYDLTEADLRAFRQRDSRTPGHPEIRQTPGVEASTGPLGQGAANSVGLAVAETLLAARYNRPGHAILDHRTYALLSDGDVMEGVCFEAASLAAHWKLHKLTWLYDANETTLDGPASRSMSEDVPARFAALGWHVVEVADGNHDLAAIDAALEAAHKERGRPSLLVVRTTIGYGAPTKAGTAKSHGAPLGSEEARGCKEALGLAPGPFAVDPVAHAHLQRHLPAGRRAVALWQARRAAWAAAYPELAGELQQALAGGLPASLGATLAQMRWDAAVSTREASGQVLQQVAQLVPQLVGGDADLSTSTMSSLVGAADYAGQSAQAKDHGVVRAADAAPGMGPQGRNLRYGVREHGMAGVANGMAYHGGVLPFVATFFAFSDYLRPALRMAAIAELGTIWLFTHDSVALGEDGPTHQPVEQLASLRAMPNLVVLRPADAHETCASWQAALQLASAARPAPVALVLSRQKLPTLPPSRASFAQVMRGAYVLREAAGRLDAVVVATGSEVHLALAAAERLATEGVAVRVVSMPSWELFAEQDESYREAVLPPAVRARVSVEAASSFGWERWLGDDGEHVALDRFGLSAPGGEVLKAVGVTVEHVVAAVHRSRARVSRRQRQA